MSMTSRPPDVLVRIGAALDALAAALVAGDTAAVLAAEAPIAAAVAELTAWRPAAEDRSSPDVVRALQAVRGSLARCQALGRSATDFSRAVLPGAAYDRAGRRPLATASAHRLTSVS
jgi:hypothetical protein